MIRCIAIDDEPLALQQLERFLQRIPGVELAGAFCSVGEAEEILESGKIDLIFLDIEMPDCNGVDFARELGDKAPHIIFITAYPQFAVEGFRLDAVDYLLKPLSFEELERAIAKVTRREGNVKKSQEAELYLKDSHVVRRIQIRDILYVKGLGEYIQIVMRNGQSHTVLERMKNMEVQLGEYSFMRVHKSYIVNMHAIDSGSYQGIEIQGVTIPVGEKYRPAIVGYLKEKYNR